MSILDYIEILNFLSVENCIPSTPSPPPSFLDTSDSEDAIGASLMKSKRNVHLVPAKQLINISEMWKCSDNMPWQGSWLFLPGG